MIADIITEATKELVQRLSGAVCHSGEVKSVDAAAGMCQVQLTTATDGAMTVPVLLNATNNSALGVTIYPTVDSDVVVANVDGAHLYVMVLMSKVDKVLMNAGSGTAEMEVTNGKVVMNGGSLGGVTKVAPVLSKLNALENEVNQLKTLLQTMIGAMTAVSGPSPGTPVTAGTLTGYFSPFTGFAAAPMTPTVRTEIEDTNVKH